MNKLARFKTQLSSLDTSFHHPSHKDSASRGGRHHREKTRVQMPAKIFPHLKLKC
jgi:hypothetical protein